MISLFVALAVAVFVTLLTRRLALAFPPRPRRTHLRPLDHQGEMVLSRRALGAVNGLNKRLQAEARNLKKDAEVARACLAAAQPLLASRDTLDLVGAIVLSRIGIERLNATRWQPCFFNPTHIAGGEGTVRQQTVSNEATVPACSDCRTNPYQDPLTVSQEGAPRLYWETDTFWARTGFGTLTDELWSDVMIELSKRC